MSKKTFVAAALLAVALSGCSSATQTGGGSSTQAPSQSAAQSAAPAAEVKPLTIDDVVGQGWLAGTAKPQFPAGTPGKTDVVASAPIVPGHGGTSVAIAVRNNTSSPVQSVEVTAAAKDAGGKIVASGRSQVMSPEVIPAGGIALGYVYFAPNTTIAADSKLSFTVASKPVSGKPYNQDLKVDQASLSGENIVGQATNTSKATLKSPYPVVVTCFDEKGGLLDSQMNFGSPDADLAPGESVTFQTGLYGKSCPSFLVGVSGHMSLS
ncbi:hypothetical protein [Sinomonas gamaensis]|uniref:hypothetical protein n=1 Tax=Sinomonas gamaensis TaxID=2565624 RepID=UPI0011099F2D|nr:hypothetical protein [Sinomonas gamaensis]